MAVQRTRREGRLRREGERIMKVTRCDRCGSIFEDSTYVTVRVIKSVNNQQDYDLCKLCEENLEEFLNITQKVKNND